MDNKTLKFKIIKLHPTDNLLYLEQNLIWAHNNEFKRLSDYDEKSIEYIYKKILAINGIKHKKIWLKILNGMSRRRKLNKLKNNIMNN